MVGMWLARKAAELIVEDEELDATEMGHTQDSGGNGDASATYTSQNGNSLISEISRLGGNILSEGGSFLSEMNDTVFNGVVGELLAPNIDDDPGRGFTIGLLSDCDSDCEEVICSAVEFFAKTGFNLLTSGPTGFSSTASFAFCQVPHRIGRSIGILSTSERMTKKTWGGRRVVEIPVFVAENDRLGVVVRSVDVLVVFQGGKNRDSWSSLGEVVGDTPCVVFGNLNEGVTPSLRSCNIVTSAEEIARFVMAECCNGDPIKATSPTVSLIAEALAQPPTYESKSCHVNEARNTAPSSSDELDTFEIIESPNQRVGLKIAS